MAMAFEIYDFFKKMFICYSSPTINPKIRKFFRVIITSAITVYSFYYYVYILFINISTIKYL